jgi:hypothetical protein
MGISGHMLGERKLRRLSERTGLPLDRALHRGHACEGRTVTDGVCTHYDIDWDSGAHRLIEEPLHWSSCPRKKE